MNAPLELRALRVAKDAPELSFEVTEPFTVLRTGRESHASATALVIAGRLRAASGEVLIDGTPADTRTRFAHVALAGAMEVDSLPRLADVRAVVREQLVWASPWYKPVPRTPDVAEPFAAAGCTANLGDVIGDLDVEQRFRLRVALALIARPDARLLVVDDVDQVKNMAIRDRILDTLAQTPLPTVALSTNPTDYPEVSL
ncbi:ABC transporter ATP-binding protein [Corynebacterium renale]|uniref:hypothetical protein n=1 Tax=Corynebacterium renale TaxID=1724 RepID=UPI000DA34CAC|nr:hypothetical protein [Corynebacterium renale]SQG63741.1 ABC transporter ATP-binding protein [Corynebacterium renale]STD01896.1 ABC transporter ATP-binding protein [Corynebacterium renale]